MAEIEQTLTSMEVAQLYYKSLLCSSHKEQINEAKIGLVNYPK